LESGARRAPPSRAAAQDERGEIVDRTLVYDVGLHKGEDTAYYLAKGYQVIAFEADPRLVEQCQRRFAGEIASGALTIVPGAITDEARSTVQFYQHPNTVWGTTNSEWARRNAVLAASNAINVPAVQFGEILRGAGMPVYLKVDIEGADRLCLEALAECDDRPQWLSIESSKTMWDELVREFDLLEGLGYHRFAVVQQARIPDSDLYTRTLDGSWIKFTFEADASGPFGEDVGPWLDREAALRRYRRIFRWYRLLGEESMIRRTRAGRIVLGRLQKYLRTPLPGWYDTHAWLQGPAAGLTDSVPPQAPAAEMRSSAEPSG
jgi:FkbM family methyltransferase